MVIKILNLITYFFSIKFVGYGQCINKEEKKK